MPYTPIGNGFSNTIRDVEKNQVFLRFGRCTRMKFKIKKLFDFMGERYDK